jgi:hypothetical protein
MKTGKTLNELAAEITRQAETKRDYVASTADMKILVANSGETALELGGRYGELLDIGHTAHEQIATQAGIPKPYYDRMLAEKPQLLADNVNTWFAEKPTKRMLRTLDGKARALLSDKYRPLDNYELLEAALPALQSANLEIVSAEVTERRMFVKAVDPSIKRFIPGGHRLGDGSHVAFKVPSGEIVPALNFGNSEIGYGTLSVTRGWLDHGCTNLAYLSMREHGLTKRHVGARLDVGDELYKLLTNEAREATDRAVWLQFRDAIKSAISAEGFDSLVETLLTAAGEEIKGDPIKVVDVTAKHFGFNETQRSSILQHLIRGGDLSKFGLANAVTSAANEQADYEVASDLENLGGRIIELPKTEWQRLSVAELPKAA